MPLPPEVSQCTDAFLGAIDRSEPGVVAGLYLHGSLGFGEFFARRSDIDYVAVLARRPDAHARAALAEAHRMTAARYPRPHFDGIHLLARDLAGPPGQCPDLPYTHEGAFHDAGRFEINPVTWHELARHAVPVRGPAFGPGQVWTDDAALRAFSRANLTDYWARVAASLERDAQRAGHPWATEWCVLGVSRLHHLLATGSLTSKCGAGRHALEVFAGQWRPVVTEALRIRRSAGPDATGGEPSAYAQDTARRARDTLAFTATAIEAALALGA
ncbi:MAG TPA: aminoglycoside adenylyltransferase domain-containing protein [Actinocrinis sp.]